MKKIPAPPCAIGESFGEPCGESGDSVARYLVWTKRQFPPAHSWELVCEGHRNAIVKAQGLAATPMFALTLFDMPDRFGRTWPGFAASERCQKCGQLIVFMKTACTHRKLTNGKAKSWGGVLP